MGAPEVVQVVTANRAAIAAHEAMAVARMARRWIGVQDALIGNVDKLAKELADKRAAGMPITQSQLWQMERYQTLLAQTRREITGYAEWADGAVTEEQRVMGLIGQQHAGSAIEAYGVAGTFTRLEPGAVEAMAGLTGAGSPLRDLLAEAWPTAVDKLTTTLVNATALGWNPRKTARAMRDAVDSGLNRMLNIARTEQNRVYRESSRQRYQDSGVVVGYKRISAKQERTCLACLLLDGTTYTVDTPLDDHVNGRCAMVPIVRGYSEPTWTTGREWFESQDEDAQRRIMGNRAFEAWHDGEIELDDLVVRRTDPVWGNTVGVRGISGLVIQ